MRRVHSCDLLQESHVGIVEQADVGNAVAQHGDARRAHAECPSRVSLAVDAGGLEHVRMHHAGSEDLHPSGALAAGAPAARHRAGTRTSISADGSVNGKKLGRKRVRVVAPKKRSREVRERRLEVDEADSLVDRESFDLREHRRVRRVEEIAAIARCRERGCESAARSSAACAPAPATCACAAGRPSARYSVSCMSIAGWSVGKLSAPKLYHSVSASGPERDGEAELAEDVVDLFDDERDRMRRALPRGGARAS